MKPIYFSGHARENMLYRGTTEEEVADAIRSVAWKSGELGRLECRKDFTYRQYWNGRFYNTKQVRPIFVDEYTGIVVVTVYVYYF